MKKLLPVSIYDKLEIHASKDFHLSLNAVRKISAFTRTFSYPQSPPFSELSKDCGEITHKLNSNGFIAIHIAVSNKGIRETKNH